MSLSGGPEINELLLKREYDGEGGGRVWNTAALNETETMHTSFREIQKGINVCQRTFLPRSGVSSVNQDVKRRMLGLGAAINLPNDQAGLCFVTAHKNHLYDYANKKKTNI